MSDSTSLSRYARIGAFLLRYRKAGLFGGLDLELQEAALADDPETVTAGDPEHFVLWPALLAAVWAFTQLPGDLSVGQPVCAGQHDLRAQRQRLRGLRPPRPPGQLLTLGVGQHPLRLGPPRTRTVGHLPAAADGASDRRPVV